MNEADCSFRLSRWFIPAHASHATHMWSKDIECEPHVEQTLANPLLLKSYAQMFPCRSTYTWIHANAKCSSTRIGEEYLASEILRRRPSDTFQLVGEALKLANVLMRFCTASNCSEPYKRRKKKHVLKPPFLPIAGKSTEGSCNCASSC